MSILLFLLVGIAAVAVMVLPLTHRGRATVTPLAAGDAEIEMAVQSLRRKTTGAGPACAACGRGSNPGDRFCPGCGATLPAEAAPAKACPACGAPLRDGDLFCGKCGRPVAAGEVQ